LPKFLFTSVISTLKEGERSRKSIQQYGQVGMLEPISTLWLNRPS